MDNGSFSYVTIVIIAIGVIMYVLLKAAEWRIFTKAGEKGWKAFIPLYSVFLSHHFIGMSHIWFVLDMILWAFEILLDVIPGIPDTVSKVFLIVTGAFTMIAEVIHINKLCNVFRKGRLFKIGMFIAPQIFSMIIAFGKSQYHKPEHKTKTE